MRDTPGLQRMPGCGKLMWFNTPRLVCGSLLWQCTAPDFSSWKRLGRGQQNKLQSNP